MKTFRTLLSKATAIFFIFTLLCGVIYPGVITCAAQLLFPNKANGSIITIDGKDYGCALIAQQYTDDSHLWGRIMNSDASTFTKKDGTPLYYAFPANLSPASEDYEALIKERIEKLKSTNPEMSNEKIPVDLITCSGSGLDPEISKAAATYQVKRIAKARNIDEEEVTEIIKRCTTNRFLGIFGEPTVNVLKVNLMLDGILK